MASLNTYLHFDGQAEEAFNFYKSVFGGEFIMLQRYKDVPSGIQDPSHGVQGDRIMHVSLPFGKSVLMGSDVPAAFPAPVVGGNFAISVAPESEEHAKQIFDGLASGGKVTMPLEKAFWGAYFGMCSDKFGINWMVNYELNK